MVAGVVTILILAPIAERTKTTDTAVIQKRLALYDDMGRNINAIRSFCQAVGRWKEYDPTKLIAFKRELDDIVFNNRFIISERTFHAYREFIKAHFQEWRGARLDAGVRLDRPVIAARMGKDLSEWRGQLSEDKVTVSEQERAYNALVQQLRSELHIVQ